MPPRAKLYAWTSALILGLLILYISARAALIPFTYDESSSVQHFRKKSASEIIHYEQRNASNHVLNSLWIHLLPLDAPDWLFRLASIVSGVVYFGVTLLILLRLQNKPLILLGYVILQFNPFVLQFFSLARGYGIALAFFATGLYFITRWYEDPQHTVFSPNLAFLFFSLASLTIFSFSYAALALAVLFLITEMTANCGISSNPVYFLKRIDGRRYVGLIFLAATLIFYVFPMSNLLLKNKQLYYGGRIGFWYDTVRSILYRYIEDHMIYGHQYNRPIYTVAVVMVQITCLLITVYGVAFYAQRRFRPSRPPLGLWLFLATCIAAFASILGHKWKGVVFLSDRAAIFFVPLFVLSILFVLDRLASRFPLTTAIPVALAALAFVNFAPKINFTHSSEWFYDADNRRFLADLAHFRDRKPTNDPVKIGLKWLLYPSLNYYREKNNLDWLQFSYEESDQGLDLYFFMPSDARRARKLGLFPIKTYSLTGNSVYVKAKNRFRVKPRERRFGRY